MFEQFMADFIAKCVADGQNTPAKMCECAEAEASLLEKRIRGIEALRTEQSYLRTIIRKLGGSKQIRRSKIPTVRVDASVSEADLDPYTRKLCVDICSYLENFGDKKTARDVMDSVASINEHSSVYLAIKWLADKGILKRDESSYDHPVIIRGDNWEKRPRQNDEDGK